MSSWRSHSSFSSEGSGTGQHGDGFEEIDSIQERRGEEKGLKNGSFTELTR